MNKKNIISFCAFIANHSPNKALIVFSASILAGVLSGLIVPFSFLTVHHIISGTHVIKSSVILINMTILLLISKGIAFHQASLLLEQAMEQLNLQIAAQLRHESFEEIQKQSLSQTILHIADIQEMGSISLKGIDVFQHLLSVITCTIYIFFFAPWAGIVLLLYILMGILLYELSKKLQQPLMSKFPKLQKRLFDLFQNVLKGFKEIKMNPQKNNDIFDNYLSPLVKKSKEISIKRSLYFTEFFRIMNFGFFIIVGFYMFVLSMIYPVKTMFIVMLLMIYLWSGLLIIIVLLPDMITGMFIIQKITPFLDKADLVNSRLYNSLKKDINSFDTLAFNDILFSYPGQETFAMGPINLTINKGECLFIIGGNGSGKSTLIQIICGLFQASSGTITIDGNPVNLTSEYQIFSAIFSNFHLFDGVYGIDTIDNKRVENLLREFKLFRKTSLINGKWKNYKHLSAGQKKRLTLVNALLEDKMIYIFDELTADQSPSFRKYFYQTILTSLKEEGKTVIVVTHDDHYFHVPDRIIEMEYGKIKTDKQV